MDSTKTLRRRLRQQMDENASLNSKYKELTQENMALYALLYEIRKAAGDPEGRLMQDDLVEHIAAMAKSEQRLNNGGE